MNAKAKPWYPGKPGPKPKTIEELCPSRHAYNIGCKCSECFRLNADYQHRYRGSKIRRPLKQVSA